jgi:Homeodomain-like domain
MPTPPYPPFPPEPGGGPPDPAAPILPEDGSPVQSDPEDEGEGTGDPLPPSPPRHRPPRAHRLARPPDNPSPLTAEQRLLLLDTWRRSGLPAGDFAALVGISKHTLYDWKRKFEAGGLPA